MHRETREKCREGINQLKNSITAAYVLSKSTNNTNSWVGAEQRNLILEKKIHLTILKTFLSQQFKEIVKASEKSSTIK